MLLNNCLLIVGMTIFLFSFHSFRLMTIGQYDKFHVFLALDKPYPQSEYPNRFGSIENNTEQIWGIHFYTFWCILMNR